MTEVEDSDSLISLNLSINMGRAIRRKNPKSKVHIYNDTRYKGKKRLLVNLMLTDV